MPYISRWGETYLDLLHEGDIVNFLCRRIPLLTHAFLLVIFDVVGVEADYSFKLLTLTWPIKV